VNSHLDVVQSIAKNLELLTNNQLDHSLLQQFRRAIDPPPLQSQAIGAIEAAPSQAYLPWRPQRLIDEDQYASASSSSTSSQDVSVFGQDERLLQERLENIPKRVLHPQTNGTRASDLAYRPAPLQRRDSVVQPVLERLREIRTGFGEVFGLPSEAIPDDMSSALADAQSALQEELDIWNQLEHRIQYDLKRRGQLLNMPSIRHEAPAVEFVELPAPALPPPLVRRNTPSLMPPPSQPIPIESSSISPNTSPSASPLSSPLLGSSYSSGGYIGSPDSNRYLSSSNSSSSGSQITRVNPIPMTL
jgi:hypothetical protein